MSTAASISIRNTPILSTKSKYPLGLVAGAVILIKSRSFRIEVCTTPNIEVIEPFIFAGTVFTIIALGDITFDTPGVFLGRTETSAVGEAKGGALLLAMGQFLVAPGVFLERTGTLVMGDAKGGALLLAMGQGSVIVNVVKLVI